MEPGRGRVEDGDRRLKLEDPEAQARRVQELRRIGRAPDRAGPDRNRRPQRLRQIQFARSDPLGDGRGQRQVASRRRHGRRDLRRHCDPRRARLRRSVVADRASWRKRIDWRERNHAADRARRRLGLPDRRARRSAEGRLLIVRRCRDRRPLAGIGQPGADRIGDRRQAGRAPPDARGSGGHFRPPRSAQGCRTKAPRGRGQHHSAR